MISTPGIDMPYYYKNFTIFIVENAPVFFEGMKSFVGILIGISIPLSIFLLIGIVIAIEGLKSIRNKEDEIYNKKTEADHVNARTDVEMTTRWRKIMEHADSGNPNDWKQAIIEADVMLDGLLIKLGYQGDSLGERLQRVQKGDFKSLDQAWEAHKVRNRIAHDGSDFILNQIEARQVIGLYRQVFEEFYHIS